MQSNQCLSTRRGLSSRRRDLDPSEETGERMSGPMVVRRRILLQALGVWALLLGFAVVNGLFRQTVLEPALGPEPAGRHLAALRTDSVPRASSLRRADTRARPVPGLGRVLQRIAGAFLRRDSRAKRDRGVLDYGEPDVPRDIRQAQPVRRGVPENECRVPSETQEQVKQMPVSLGSMGHNRPWPALICPEYHPRRGVPQHPHAESKFRPE
jgi:hypothetical protein